MDYPNPILTFHADYTGLSAPRSRKLQTTVTTVEHCVGLWQPFIAAATSQPRRVALMTMLDPDPETTPTMSVQLSPDTETLVLQVPLGLLKESPSQLAARILDVIVPALVTLAEQHPHPQPPVFWETTEEWQPPSHDLQPGIQLEDLLEGSILVIGCHNGTPADAESRERALDAYICERLEEPGIAARDGAFATNSAVAWTLELLRQKK